MNEYLAYEHMADLRRDAAAHRRVASRADRAPARVAQRATLRNVLHLRHTTAVGCEA